MRFERLVPYAVFAGLVAAYAAVNPLRLEHYAILALMVGLAAGTARTRDLLVSLVPLAIFGWVYDLMRLFEDATWDRVTVEGVYRLEQILFGWMTPGADSLGPVDFFRDHHWIVLDALGGAFYTFHIPPLVAFGLLLWWRTRPPIGAPAARQRLHRYWWGFLVMCLITLGIHLLFPVAPPWYAEQFGMAPPGGPIAGDPAGLSRLDAAFGINYFQDVYARAPYVFGALPSLHAAFPVWLALHVRHRVGRIFAWLFAAGMGLFAVYLTHHYVVDIVAGAAVALGVYALFSKTHASRVPRLLHRRLHRIFFPDDPRHPADEPEETPREQTASQLARGTRTAGSSEGWPRPLERFGSSASVLAASLCGVGRLPAAPGTWGTLAALPLVVGASHLPIEYRLAGCTALVAVAVPIVDRAGRDLGVVDSPRIVLDEAVGIWATLVWFASPSWTTVAIGVAAFRLFDVAKPPGARWFDRRSESGIDVVADDVVAALWALPFVTLAHWFL